MEEFAALGRWACPPAVWKALDGWGFHMSKKTIISAQRSGRIVAVLGASLLVGGLVAGCGSDTTTAEDASTAETVDPENAAPTDKGGDDRGGDDRGGGKAAPTENNRKIIESAMGGGYAAVCTFNIEGGEGTMHIGGQERFHFEGTSQGAPAMMMRSDDTMYIWTPGETDGISIKVSEAGAQAGPDPMDLPDNANYRDLSCERYNGDMKIFDVPADVTFMTMQEILSGVDQGAGD